MHDLGEYLSLFVVKVSHGYEFSKWCGGEQNFWTGLSLFHYINNGTMIRSFILAIKIPASIPPNRPPIKPYAHNFDFLKVIGMTKKRERENIERE